MRVLHVVKTAEGATWALRQMRELAAIDAEVHVLIPDGSLTQAYRDAGVEVHKLEGGLRGLAVRLPRTVNRLRPDLVHTHFVNQTLVARAVLRSHTVPRVFQVPGPLHLEYAPTRQLDTRSADDRDFWIAACQWTRNTYLRNVRRPEHVGMSFYGTDVAAFTERARHRTPEDVHEPPVVGMVAYFYKPKPMLGQRVGLKGHEDFIDAVRLMMDDGLDLQAVVAGGAWGGAQEYAASVRRYARERCGPQVQFLGHVDDVPTLYNSIDIAVHPSHSENHGGAVESLLMGVPTVTTTVGGFPDIVRDRETGLLAPPRSPPGLAKAVRTAIADPTASLAMARRGQALVRRDFDVHATARQVRSIYEAILAGQPLG